jgi:hypothetical protein
VCLGLPGPGGAPVTVVMTNATAGADRTPGFHAAEAAMQVDGKTTLTFGYYAGPAEVIVARTGQRSQKVTAHQAIWSEDPTVVFFWFDAGSGTVTDLEALDKNGRTLPRGDNQIGVG